MTILPSNTFWLLIGATYGAMIVWAVSGRDGLKWVCLGFFLAALASVAVQDWRRHR